MQRHLARGRYFHKKGQERGVRQKMRIQKTQKDTNLGVAQQALFGPKKET